MKTIEEINDYIEKSYRELSFDPDHFEFYKTRKEKRRNSIGILNLDDKKYFFKIVKDDEYNDEELIKNKISPYFRIVEKYSERQIDGETLNLYEYIDAPGKNAFNYLRNKDISLVDKDKKLSDFFDKKIEFMNKTVAVADMNHSAKADRWFYERIKSGSRFDIFYGKDGELLLNDINDLCNDGVDNYRNFITNMFDYLSKEHKLVESYSHGDFHDFNFSLDGLFWDIDTFGMNPILNDFSVYYWHFYGREDTFVYKYSPWLTNYMYDNLSVEQLNEVRGLKEKYILKWYDAIENVYKNNDLYDGLKDEFLYKLFCRIFLISNILEYDLEDRKIVYDFFNHYIKDKNESVKELLFTNPVKLPYGGK